MPNSIEPTKQQPGEYRLISTTATLDVIQIAFNKAEADGYVFMNFSPSSDHFAVFYKKG